jgi:hypothetical protein
MKNACYAVLALCLIINSTACNNLKGNNYSKFSSESSGINSEVNKNVNSALSDNISNLTSSLNDTLDSSDSSASDLNNTLSTTANSNISSKSISKSINTAPKIKATPTPAIKKPVLGTREKLNDVGSHVWDGYLYFEPPISYSYGFYKKKINSNEGVIKLADETFSAFDVLDNVIYYSTSNSIYRMDTDGKNIKLLYKSFSLSKVAGLWIFANQGSQLYMLRTDGSKVIRLSPNTSYDYRSESEVLGFDHGFCYYSAYNQWISQNQTNPNSIQIGGESVNKRVDYRNSNPYFEDTDSLFLGHTNVKQVIYGKAFFDMNPCSYINLANNTIKEIPVEGYRNGGNFFDNYIFYTHEKRTQTSIYEYFRFQNLSNGQFKEFPNDVNLNYSNFYQDINNNDMYISCMNKNGSIDVVRYNPDGTQQKLFNYDKGGNFT